MPRLTVTALQGGADAFVQANMATALTGIKGTAFKVIEMGFEIVLPATGQFPIGTAAAQEISMCMTRRTKAAMPNISDIDVIKKWKFSGAFSTAVGWQNWFEPAQTWVPPQEILIVEDPLFFQLDSTGTGGTWSVVCNVDYEVVKISDIDRLTLLTQSLD